MVTRSVEMVKRLLCSSEVSSIVAGAAKEERGEEKAIHELKMIGNNNNFLLCIFTTSISRISIGFQFFDFRIS